MNKIKREHKYGWVWEKLEHLDTYALRSMFGAKSVYLRGKIMLCLTEGAEPWNGVLVCTDKAEHESLCAEFRSLKAHPVLGKWLYLSDESRDFEQVIELLIKAILRGDPRIGVVPKPKGKRAKSPIKFGQKL